MFFLKLITVFSPCFRIGAGTYRVTVGPTPAKRPMLTPFTKTTPRLLEPQLALEMKVSVGSPVMVITAFVRVGQLHEGAFVFQLLRLYHYLR